MYQLISKSLTLSFKSWKLMQTTCTSVDDLQTLCAKTVLEQTVSTTSDDYYDDTV